MSDEIVCELIEGFIKDDRYKNRIIFDGYPRSLSQAKNLDNLLKNSNQKIDLVLFLNVDKKTIIERIEKRKILEKRSDDDSATLIKRHDTYMQTTKPVLEHYNKNSNFYEIDGGLKIEEITGKIEDIINV